MLFVGGCFGISGHFVHGFGLFEMVFLLEVERRTSDMASVFVDVRHACSSGERTGTFDLWVQSWGAGEDSLNSPRTQKDIKSLFIIFQCPLRGYSGL